jgi:hypothetical protein
MALREHLLIFGMVFERVRLRYSAMTRKIISEGIFREEIRTHLHG